tara:strand:+ start:260 stop:904 length:645 start_codon:yes stop_codon:yes gene_type:complete
VSTEILQGVSSIVSQILGPRPQEQVLFWLRMGSVEIFEIEKMEMSTSTKKDSAEYQHEYQLCLSRQRCQESVEVLWKTNAALERYDKITLQKAVQFWWNKDMDNTTKYSQNITLSEDAERVKCVCEIVKRELSKQHRQTMEKQKYTFEQQQEKLFEQQKYMFEQQQEKLFEQQKYTFEQQQHKSLKQQHKSLKQVTVVCGHGHGAQICRSGPSN